MSTMPRPLPPRLPFATRRPCWSLARSPRNPCRAACLRRPPRPPGNPRRPGRDGRRARLRARRVGARGWSWARNDCRNPSCPWTVARLGGVSAHHGIAALSQFCIARHRDRSGHRQHRRLPRGRASSSTSRRWLRWKSSTASGESRGRKRSQADDGQDAGQHHDHPAAARRRHRRPRNRRADDQALHPKAIGARHPSRGPEIVVCVPSNPPRSSAGRSAPPRPTPARARSGWSRSRWRRQSAPDCRSTSRSARWSSTSAAAPPKSAWSR